MGLDCGHFSKHHPIPHWQRRAFGHLHQALSQTYDRICLTPGSPSDISDWRDLVADLSVRPTHLREVVLLPPT